MNVAIASASPTRRADTNPGADTHRSRPRGAGVAVTRSFAAAVTVDSSNPAALPLWNGAWVGWLTCQAVLLVLVESTELATDPRIALVTRALLLTAFVAAFRKPCFFTRAQRNMFTLCVLAAELGIAAGCNRLANTTGWPLWVTIGAALLLLSTSLAASEPAVNSEP
jgi:hypothetical protein